MSLRKWATTPSNMLYVIWDSLPPPNDGSNIFISLVCWFVSVCLFVSVYKLETSQKKWVSGFSWNFPDRSDMAEETIVKFFEMLGLNLCFFFYFWWGKSVSVNNIADKCLNGFSWNFWDWSDMTNKTSSNIWGLTVSRLGNFTPLKQGATEVCTLGVLLQWKDLNFVWMYLKHNGISAMSTLEMMSQH